MTLWILIDNITVWAILHFKALLAWEICNMKLGFSKKVIHNKVTKAVWFEFLWIRRYICRFSNLPRKNTQSKTRASKCGGLIRIWIKIWPTPFKIPSLLNTSVIRNTNFISWIGLAYVGNHFEHCQTRLVPRTSHS